MKRSIPLAALAAVFAVGCSSDPIVTAPPVQQMKAGMSDIARNAAESAARSLAADVREGRAAAVADRMDLKAFVDGVFTGLAVRRQVREDFQKGFEQGLADREGGMLSDYLEQDFRFLRLIEVDGHSQMLFRAWDEEDGVNYLRGALRKLERVSGKLRGQRFARLLKLQILSGIVEEPEAYAAALAKFSDDFPDDPSSPLLRLEYHSLRGESERALECIDELEAQLGGDPFLHFMRAGALSALGRESEAVDGLQEAVTAEPEIEELRWALIQAALAAGEHEIVAQTLRALRRDFEYQMSAEEIAGAEEYREFASSGAGKALLGELRAPPGE